MTVPPSTLPGLPVAEIGITRELVVRLLETQHPDLVSLPLSPVAEGWDNAVFRLGDHLAVRLPRRAVAAELIRREQRFLPLIQQRLTLPIPAAIRIGDPDASYPWPWSVTPWFDGETADRSPAEACEALALCRFFLALHVRAPSDIPQGRSRGVPLASRAAIVEHRLADLARRRVEVAPELGAIWRAGLAEPVDAEPTWIHGDPHPRNILVAQGRIVAMIDWGDMAQGDRASDLASFWMLFDRAARAPIAAALPAVSEATWRRARAWAFAYAVLFLTTERDDPGMAAIGRSTLRNLAEDL